MSWVFLAPRLQLKKPVVTSYLDCSTVERRESNCREEVRLNRRLARDVYRAVVPLVAGSGGALSLDGSARWLKACFYAPPPGGSQEWPPPDRPDFKIQQSPFPGVASLT